MPYYYNNFSGMAVKQVWKNLNRRKFLIKRKDDPNERIRHQPERKFLIMQKKRGLDFGRKKFTENYAVSRWPIAGFNSSYFVFFLSRA